MVLVDELKSKHSMKRLKALCIILLALAGKLYAAPIVSATSGNWNDASTWVGNIIPGAGDIVTIANGHTVTVTTNAFCTSLSIGNAPNNQSSTLSVNAGITLSVSGNITITPPSSGIFDNTLNVNAGIVSCSSFISSNSLNDNNRCIVNISTGTLTCTGSFMMGSNSNRNKLVFSGGGLLQTAGNSNTINNAQFTPATGTIEYNGNFSQAVLPLNYYTLKCSGTSTKGLVSNTVVSGDVIIAGAASLDVSSTNNFSLTVGGNWTVTSTNASPFLRRRGTVIFNGASGVQVISTVLTRESFYNLTISNTAGNTGADIEITKSCLVTQAYTHTSGTLDLKGNRLTVVSENQLGVFTSCNLSGGNIISTVSGAQISFADTYDSTFVNFTGTSVGSSNIPVALTVNTGRINLQNLRLYGTGAFTKRHASNDITAKGGNKFYNTISFTLNSTAGQWHHSAGDGALPDSFFARVTYTSFAGNANASLIAGANSSGNYYGDDVIFNVRSAGSIMVGNSSGATNGTASTNFFGKLADVVLTSSGSMHFSEGQSLLPSTTIFNGLLRIGSAAGATGSVYVGKNNSGSAVQITASGQIITGYIYGTTSVYLYNVTQTGTLAQTFTNIVSPASSIIVGGSNGPCVWNGPVTFTASVLDLAYSTFNGSTNTFNLRNSTTAQNCTGGNIFAASSTNWFNNFGSANWYFATMAGDDFNGDAYYRANGVGAIYPAYTNNCTYAGNIVILPSSDSIVFAAGAGGRVTFDGPQNSFFINNSAKSVSFMRISLNKVNSTITLYSHIFMPSGGDLNLTAGRMITGNTGMVIIQHDNFTITNVTAASTTYVDGPMRIEVIGTNSVNLHFPIGKNGEARPVELTVQHTSNTSYSYTAEMMLSSANALGWTNPASVYNTSARRWWDITRTVTATGASAPTTDLVTTPLPLVSLYYGLNDRAIIPANLTICKNTFTASTTWIDIGAVGATNSIGKVTSTSVPSPFNSFSRFTFGYYGIPPAPVAHDSSRCGPGVAAIRASGASGDFIDWYAAPAGGVALASGTNIFNTPFISVNTTYYAEARNSKGAVSATRTPVTAFITDLITISGVTPNQGVTGTIVTITGTNFSNTITSVSFGGVAASSYTVNSSTQITATVATGASGAVEVTNACGPVSSPGFVFNPLTTWTGAINTSWTTAGNWDKGVPTNIHSAIIPSVVNQPLIISNQTIRAITIQPGATVDIAAGNSLNIRDSLTSNGIVIGGGSVVLSGTNSQPVRGNGIYSNLTLNNSNGAIIQSGAGNMVNITGRYTPTAGVLVTNNNFTLKSTSTENGIIAAGASVGGYISGRITMERYVQGRRAWRLINFPITLAGAPGLNASLQEGAGGNATANPNPGYGTHITGGTIGNGFDQNASNNPSVKEWVGGVWQGVNSTNAPISSQYPYFVFVRGSRANNLAAGTAAPVDNTTLRLTANIKQGNQLISVSGTGWQLTGNPFPSIISLDAIGNTNSNLINKNFVYWDPRLGGSNNVGGFVTASYNGAGYDFSPTPVSPLSEYAQPFAGFYVDAVSTGSLSVLETHKCNCGSGNVFRPAPRSATTSKLRINLRSVNQDGTNPVVDGAFVSFDERFSNGKDSYDATKLPNTLSENVAIKRSENKFAIERRKAIAFFDTVYLNISNMRIKNYQFEITPENFDTLTTFAYLEDSYTQERKQVSLSAGSNFQFGIFNNPAVYAPDRFRIVFERDQFNGITAQKLQTQPLLKTPGSVKLLQNPVRESKLKLEMHDKVKGSYHIIISDTDGRQLATKQIYHDGNNSVKTINLGKQLAAGQSILTIKEPGGNNTSLNILVQ